MDRIMITADSTADDLAGIALCIHTLTGGLPVTARSRNRHGVQVEDGKVTSRDYSGPLLERAISEKRTLRERPDEGPYKGIPVTTTPLIINGEPVAAFGVVDVSGSLDFKAQMDQYSRLHKQVTGQ